MIYHISTLDIGLKIDIDEFTAALQNLDEFGIWIDAHIINRHNGIVYESDCYHIKTKDLLYWRVLDET